MKKLVALASVVLSLTASAVVGVTHVHASAVCASASVEVNVNGSDVVNQATDQCTPV